ncbi:hypothetical protein C8R47DRAFT_1139310 [Mycena vitilis]|nr:hypothetical protein C8R47DRAFT_1139310 [Mycena vitilis]
MSPMGSAYSSARARVRYSRNAFRRLERLRQCQSARAYVDLPHSPSRIPSSYLRVSRTPQRDVSLPPSRLRLPAHVYANTSEFWSFLHRYPFPLRSIPSRRNMTLPRALIRTMTVAAPDLARVDVDANIEPTAPAPPSTAHLASGADVQPLPCDSARSTPPRVGASSTRARSTMTSAQLDVDPSVRRSARGRASGASTLRAHPCSVAGTSIFVFGRRRSGQQSHGRSSIFFLCHLQFLWMRIRIRCARFFPFPRFWSLKLVRSTVVYYVLLYSGSFPSAQAVDPHTCGYLRIIYSYARPTCLLTYLLAHLHLYSL